MPRYIVAKGTASGVVMATEAPRVVCVLVLDSVVFATGFGVPTGSLVLFDSPAADELDFVFEIASLVEFCGATGSAPAEGRLKRGMIALLPSLSAASVPLSG